MHRISGDGNCLFHALCYVITGSEREHFKLRSLIIHHLRTEIRSWRLIPNHINEMTLEDYITNSQIDQLGVWGTETEMLVLAHVLEVNIAFYNQVLRSYQIYSPGVIEPDAFQEDNSRPTIYVVFTGNHFNVVLSQD